jgi:uncharacterized protein
MMDAGRLYGKGISFPPRLGPDGRFAWSAGPQNIRESIRIILLTQVQERLMLPEFGGGLQSFLFDPNAVSTHRLIQNRVTQALERWEPRIQLVSVSVTEDPADNQIANVNIIYKLVATDLEDQLSLAVQLST